MSADIEFVSDGVVLRGRLYRPEDSRELRPAVVMTHGFSATITMVVDKYAEVFAEAGFVVLPEDAPFASDFLVECEAFTADDSHAHDDQIDPMCDAITDMLLTKRSSLFDFT